MSKVSFLRFMSSQAFVYKKLLKLPAIELFNSFMTDVPYHIETSPLICRANQWTGFYMIKVFVMKELIKSNIVCICFTVLTL